VKSIAQRCNHNHHDHHHSDTSISFLRFNENGIFEIIIHVADFYREIVESDRARR
jgi:hypothetical protein